nr:MAG TPA: hypothetical protein [Caudoviricetes sp.]
MLKLVAGTKIVHKRFTFGAHGTSFVPLCFFLEFYLFRLTFSILIVY